MADEKQSSLTVLGGPLAGSQTSLPTKGVVTIGAAADCTFQLSIPSVSPLHARVVVEDGHATVETIDTQRPLYINDNPLAEGSVELRNGDILWLGAPGEEDVVMLQCILPPAPEEAPAAAPTPEVETQALWTTPAAGEASPPEGGGEATVAFVPESSPEAAAPAADPAGDDEPLIIAFDGSAEEEEGVLVDEPGFIAPDDAQAAPPESVTPAESPAAGEDAFVAEPGPTLVTGPDDVDVSAAPPTVALPAEGVAEVVPTVEPLVETQDPPVVTPEEPPTPASPPPPAPAPPSASTPSAGAPAAPRPRDRSAPGPGASARRSRPPSLRRGPKPPPRPTDLEESADKAAGGGSSRSPAVFAVAGFVGVVVVVGLGFALWHFVLAKPSPEPTPVPVAAATAAPPPVTPTAAPPVAPTPDTSVAAAPLAMPTPTPAPTPLPAATPTPAAAQPTPTPRTTPTPTPTPPPAPAAAPAGPSPAELQAQQNAARVQELLGLSDTAIAARQYEAAVGHLDEALRLEPGNSRATTTRARAVALRDLARRQFVGGRTRVQSAKAQGGGGLAGFDTGDTDLRQASDVQGRIEFEMTPPSGIAPGDSWTLRIFVVNDGKKTIEVEGLTATTRINGQSSEGPVTPQARRVATQQRTLVGQTSGTWTDGTTAWSTRVTVTANKGDSLSATLSWK